LLAVLNAADKSRSLPLDGILDTGCEPFGEESNGTNDPAPPYCEVRWGFLDFAFFFGAGSWNGISVNDHENRPCGAHSTKTSTPDTLPRRTCSSRRAETILWGCQGWRGWKLDERTISFSFGQHFGEIDVGFPNLGGIPHIISEASNLHELSARDTGRTLGGLWG